MDFLNPSCELGLLELRVKSLVGKVRAVSTLLDEAEVNVGFEH